MNIDHQRKGANETISFTQPVRVLVGLLVVVPLLTLAQIAYLFIADTVPLILGVLLTLVALSSLTLAATAFETLCETKMTLTSERLSVERLLGQQGFPWSDVARVAVVPATGSLGDDPNEPDQGRLGIGVFLHSSQKLRSDPLDADAIVLAVSNRRADVVLRAVEIIEAYRLRLGSRQVERPRMGPAAKSAAPFRRPRSTAADAAR